MKSDVRQGHPDPGRREPNALRRSLRLPGLVLYGMGTTIGAGVYALTGVIAGEAGMQAPLAFAAASLVAALSAGSFAELSARFPRAGGEAVYVQEGIGRPALSAGVGLLVTLAGIVSAATVCRAFVGTLNEFVSVPALATLVLVCAAVGSIAAFGIRESVTAAAIMTVVEIGGLLLIAGFAGDAWLTLPERAGEFWPTGTRAWVGIGAGAMLSFYAFLGFEDMVNVAEEVRDVRRTLPLAIALTLVATTLLYLMTATAAVLVVPPAELATSDAPLALVFSRSGGPAWLLGAIASFAMLNGALVQIVKSARMLYGLADLDVLPSGLGAVNARTRTPLRATAVITALVAALALFFPVASLAALTSAITLVTFSLANLALILVKRRSRAPEGVRPVHMAVPIAGFVATAGFALWELLRRLA